MGSRTEFSVESLESRKMMAGDVTARVINGDLVITGDNQDNEIYVYQMDSDSYALFGENGTRINGLIGHPFHGVSDDVRINLRNGDNKIAFQGLELPDDILVRTGNGNDLVIFEGTTVRSDVRIRTGAGDDTVFVMESTVGGLLSAVTAGGNDEMVATRSAFVRATVNTGAGNDEAYFSNLDLHQPSRFNLGGGEDLAWVSTDTSVISAANLILNGGGGNDVYERYFAGEAIISNFEGDGIDVDDFTINVDFNNEIIEANLDLSID